MLFRVLFLVFTSCLLIACSSQPSGPSIPPPTSVSHIIAWDISGRIGIRTQDDALSGNFNWQRNADTFDLNISGPFGQGATSLVKEKDALVTLSYDDKTVIGESAKQLLADELGWAFPVEQVAYWVRGLPSPNSAAVIIPAEDNLEQIHQLDQDGWLVEYKSYTKVSELELPQRIQISKAPYRVNLIINHWTIQ